MIEFWAWLVSSALIWAWVLRLDLKFIAWRRKARLDYVPPKPTVTSWRLW